MLEAVVLSLVGLRYYFFFFCLVLLLCGLKVLNHASRTLPYLPYTNLKKSRTEKKLVTEHV